MRRLGRRMYDLIEFDEYLCDMTEEEENALVYHLPYRWTSIDNFPDDDVALKQTKFTKDELQQIYEKFDLPSDEEGQWTVEYGEGPNQRRYHFHTEQLFLYAMISCRSGASHVDMADDVFGGTDGGRRWCT